MKKSTKYIGSAVAILLGVVVVSLSGEKADANESDQLLEGVEIPEGCSKLVFFDEFDADGMPDSTKWTWEEGYVRNGEMQYYTNGANAWCENSRLIIEARADSAIIDGQVCPVTSASITTKDRAAWKYCYVEVRAKLPSFRGSWPAIWMMPDANIYGDWPRSGEIDIMEHVGYEPGNIHFAAHSDRYNHMRGIQKNCVCPAPDCTADFHTYGLRREPGKISWYYDGVEKFSLEKENDADWTSWPFDSDFYLILNFAVGGGWGGMQGVDMAGMPARYEIDYVRIFQ